MKAMHGDQLSPGSETAERLASGSAMCTDALADRIRHRIEVRLPGRIRGLTVVVIGEEVELGGRCATFYSKQLAQHVAMGVIDHQRLVNSIEVGV